MIKWFIVSVLLVGCGSTSVDRKIKLDALANGVPVKIFDTELPEFDYEVVCEISIKSNGAFTSGNRSSYNEKISNEARTCGATMAINERLLGYRTQSSTNVTVTAKAIRQTSAARFFGKSQVEKLKLALRARNYQAIGGALQGLEKKMIVVTLAIT